MRTSPAIRPSVVAAAGLIGGYAAAKLTGRREVGGAIFSAAGAWCSREWSRTLGPVPGAAMSALYTAAMGGSHPLAKKLGGWPSVFAVAAVTVVASELLTRWAENR